MNTRTLGHVSWFGRVEAVVSERIGFASEAVVNVSRRGSTLMRSNAPLVEHASPMERDARSSVERTFEHVSPVEREHASPVERTFGHVSPVGVDSRLS